MYNKKTPKGSSWNPPDKTRGSPGGYYYSLPGGYYCSPLGGSAMLPDTPPPSVSLPRLFPGSPTVPSGAIPLVSN